jgi:hypothetical protein
LSLQFHLATGYFSMIPGRVYRQILAWAGTAFLAGCGTRDRLTFPSESPGDGFGPTTEIAEPSVPDTAIVAGHLLIVAGRSFDPDGVDTVYVEVSGINQGVAPIPGEGKDTVDFAVQLSTTNHSGATVLVQVHGVDLLGNLGSIISRQIRIE